MPRPTPAAARGTPTLVATALRLDRGASAVLRDVSVVVGPGMRLGVVGPNGVGKSTLLRVLAGELRPDAGTVRLQPPGTVVGYLAQEPVQGRSDTVRQLLHRATGVAGAEEALAVAATALAAGTGGAGDRYDEALARLAALAPDGLDARIRAVLDDLGLGAATADRPAAALSGGQRARVGLAAVVLSRFGVTLLDEPTNDLDFDGLARLESFVLGVTGPLVVVSHDRAFLERTVTDVLEIDEHDHSARLFGGGWGAYVEERATARRHAAEAHAAYVARRLDLRDRAQRERQWAQSGVRREQKARRDNDKAQRGFRVDRTEQLASRARRTERALDRLAVVDKPWEGWQLRFTIGEARRAGEVVARLDGAVVRRGTFTLGPLDLEIAWGERLSLVGPNGAGKTTLVGALLGRFPLSAGTRWLGPSVVVGEMAQERHPAGDGSVLDDMVASSALPVTEARALLAKFGLGADHLARPASSLSPGERTRATLAGFQGRGVNVLVLDEPTNHLDLPAIEQLEEALAGFGGTLLVVTHDRRLLEALDVDRTLALPAAATQP